MPKDPTQEQARNVTINPSLQEEIRRRAYALYEERAREDGHDIDDWLRAEAEVTTALKAAA
jgi:hypothetical protein